MIIGGGGTPFGSFSKSYPKQVLAASFFKKNAPLTSLDQNWPLSKFSFKKYHTSVKVEDMTRELDLGNLNALIDIYLGF